MPGERLSALRGRCLGPDLTAYADRAMDAVTLRHWDRHLVACMCCRQAVEDERRVLQALRGSAGPAVPGDLRSLLLSLGQPGQSLPGPAGQPLPGQAAPPAGSPFAGAPPSGPAAPEVPTPGGPIPGAPAAGQPARGVRGTSEMAPVSLAPFRMAPIPVVGSGTPALHRSAVRATVCAGLAAGATAAAAWGLAVTSGGLTTSSVPASSPALRARPAVPASVTVTSTARPAFGSAPAAMSAVGASRSSVTAVAGWQVLPAVSANHAYGAQSSP